MRGTFWRFLWYTRPYKGIMAGAALTGVLKFSLALALPLTLTHVIRHVIPEVERAHDPKPIYGVIGVLLVVLLGRAVATYFRSYWAAVAGNRAIFDVRRDLFRHVQQLSLRYHHERRSGETISRIINDLNQCQGIVNQGIVAIAMDITFLIGVTVFLFIWDWRLAAVSMLTLPIYGVVFAWLNPRLREAAKAVQEEMEEMSGDLTEKISAIPVVISHAREKTEEHRFFQRHRVYFNKVLRRVRVRMALTCAAEFLQALGPMVVISYGAYRVATDAAFDVAALVGFYGVLAHLYLPTRRLADYSAQMQLRLAALDRVFEVLDSDLDIHDSPGAQPLDRVEGRLAFDNVTFGYHDDEPVLHDIDLTIEPGESVAFVGRSGAGKSSIVNLVPRFYDPQQGSVQLDGRDLRTITVRSLRDQIGIVLQDSILFSGTIAENILYGRHNATGAEMMQAAEMAHVTEFVDELPHGFDTIVGERGVSLSGGQKQRISIARAFLRDPRILILDEATSSLDSGAESIIQEALKSLMQGRTTLLIAHRLSTIADCDRVVVLEHGQVVEAGSHSSLLAAQGAYWQLCREQFGGLDLELARVR